MTEHREGVSPVPRLVGVRMGMDVDVDVWWMLCGCKCPGQCLGSALGVLGGGSSYRP